MAWRSTGATNKELITNLFTNGIIESPRVRDAMISVDRAHYAPRDPYQDSPQGIGYEATISAPHMHAHAAQALLPSLKPGAKVLDIGSGSGYLTHVLAELVGPTGKVIGIEHISALASMATDNMGKSAEGKALLRDGRVKFVVGDGRKGWVEEAPYDAIHVGAAADGWHEELIEQLAMDGRMFIPVEERGEQYIWLVEKDGDGEVRRTKMFGVRYVPLTNAPR